MPTQKIQKTRDPCGQLAVAVEHRVDGLKDLDRMGRKQLDQMAVGAVGLRHEIGQAGDAGIAECQCPQGFAAGGQQRRLDDEAVAVGPAQRPAVE